MLLKETSPGNVIIVSQVLQCVSIITIIIFTVILNISIIIHISKCSVKNKVNSYVLTKHLCIVDLLGGVLILPLPLIATWNGKLEFLNILLCPIKNSSNYTQFSLGNSQIEKHEGYFKKFQPIVPT